MNNIKILWIILKLIIIHSSCVFSKSTYCTSSADLFCQSNNSTDFNEKDSIIKKYPNQLHITNKKLNVLLKDGLKNLSSPSIKMLRLDLADIELYIQPGAFSNLKSLENLEINTATVLLNPNTFYEIKNLTYLKIQLTKGTTPNLIDVLNHQLKLHTLKLLNHHDVDICSSTRNSISINISQLQYTGGSIEILAHKSFICLKNLQNLTITKSNLTLLKPGAFDGLNKLKIVSLISNDKLTHIPANVFNIQSLKIINLSNNSISRIDDGALTIENNSLSILNLSYNSLEFIEEETFRKLQCSFLDLTENGMLGIIDGAFKTSRIDIINLFHNQLFTVNYFNWGLNYNSTIVYINHTSFDIVTMLNNNGKSYTVITLDKLNQLKKSYICYLSLYSYFKICKTQNDTFDTVMKLHEFWQPPTLEIIDNELSLIENNAFNNLSITTLSISSTAEKFTIKHSTFAGLPNLKVLKINTQPIYLKTPTFYHLQSLTTLEIPLINPQNYLCESFLNLVSLETLFMSNYNKIDVCEGTCRTISFNIQNLQYKKSTFTKLQSLSLFCLTKLEYFSSTTGQLETIHTHAFVGLENLKSLDLSSNKLTHIDQNVFKELIQLNYLILNHNKINVIEDKALENMKLSLLDLSHNELIAIGKYMFYGVQCKHLDLSNNKLIFIENSAFNKINIKLLYLYNNTDIKKSTATGNLDESKIQRNCVQQDSFIICTKMNSLTCVNKATDKLQLTNLPAVLRLAPAECSKLELSNEISSIDNYAFKYSDIKTCLKTLIFYKTDDVFMIYPESFVGLTELENLELNVGPILLKAHLFDNLPSLKFLKIQVRENFQYLSQVLTTLENLKTLEIVGNHSVGICQNIFSHNIPQSLTDIRYTNSLLEELRANSLSCMPQIEKLTITNTNLMTIQANSFKSMENLKYLSLGFNKITMIQKDTFNGIKCNDLHLSHNKIKIIENDSFEYTNIKNLYLNNITTIVSIDPNWKIPASTICYINEQQHRSTVCISDNKKIKCNNQEATVPRLG